MKFIRWFLGKIILFLDAVFAPRSLQRSPAEQARVDERVRGLVLYQFAACPFCVKVRRFLKSQGVVIPLQDAKTEPHRSALLAGGGKLQVPCLRIPQGAGAAPHWLYESSDIISYLKTELRL